MTVLTGFLILDGGGFPVDGDGCALLFDTYEQALAYCDRKGDPTWRPVPAWDNTDDDGQPY